VAHLPTTAAARPRGCRCSTESKGLMQQCLPAQLLISKSELDRGLERHPMCPDYLKRFHRGEQQQAAGALVL